MKHPLSALLFVLQCLPGHCRRRHRHLRRRCRSQVPSPPTRSAFLRQVMADSQLLTQQYERALAKVETEVATAGDYEEARAIRQRREQLQALYTGTVSSLATPLPLPQARMMGSAQASGETLSGWRSNDSGAEWLNFRLMPGSYHLEFEANMSDAPVAGSIYASSKFQPQHSALFEFDEVTLLGIAAENHRTFEITRSTDETTFTTVRVGPLAFSPLPQSPCGSPPRTAILPTSSAFAICGSCPSRDDTATSTTTTSPPASSTTAMQQASATLKDAINTARQAATAKYLDELNDLAVSKPALKVQIEAEIRRMQRQGDQKSGRTGLRSLSTSGGGVSGFEDISDARLADEEPLSGERFKVVYEGRTLMVRLPLDRLCTRGRRRRPRRETLCQAFQHRR